MSARPIRPGSLDTQTNDPRCFIEQRAKRDHGASFDRLVRQARKLCGADLAAAEATDLSPKSHRLGNRRSRGVKTSRRVTTRKAPERAKREMARLGIEPRTPRFSVDPENPWLSADLQDFFW